MSEKYGFVYIWFDRKYRRFYIGCRWGRENDGYICSSKWMNRAYSYRSEDFKRRILKTNIQSRVELYEEEQRWLNMIKPEEIKPLNPKPRYYNLNIKNNEVWHKYDEHLKSVGQKISAAKKGKSTGPCSPEKAKHISDAKKTAFAERRTSQGYVLTPEQCEEISRRNTGRKQTEEWKRDQSKRVKQQWASGQRRRGIKFWITNGIINRLSADIPNGWYKGRVMSKY